MPEPDATVAGVRSLTDAVTIEILQMQKTTRAADARNGLHAYRPALARVLDGDPFGLERLPRPSTTPPSHKHRSCRSATTLQTSAWPPADMQLKALYVPADADTGATLNW